MTNETVAMLNHQNIFSYAVKTLLVGALVTICLVATSAIAETGHRDLVVRASGFADESGQAVANLFREGDDVLHKPHILVTASIQNGKATLTFPQLPYGNYAISVFHDKNSNNKIDHNFVNFPAEPLGFSNGFKLSLFSGLPSFEKLRFTFGADMKPMEIIVH
jgi:uncharacterized protein (DUF2141 family)